jgi:flagellar secretion chaperone FliS
MNPLQQYRSYQTETVGPEEQVALLYGGTVRFVDQALANLEAGNLEAASRYTGRAQEILGELSASLDLTVGEVAQNLFRLYDYWIWRLSQGLMQRDATAYREVSTALADMQEGWAQAARSVRTQRAVASGG